MNFLKKTNSIPYKLICAMLVIICLFIPIFTFTGCAENGTFYVGIISKRNSNIPTDPGGASSTTPADIFRDNIWDLSQNIIEGLVNEFGVSNSVSEENFADYKNLFEIDYELSYNDLLEFAQDFSIMRYFTYCTYVHNSNQYRVIVLSNKPSMCEKSYIDEHIVSFSNGEFYCETGGVLPVTREMFQISNVSEKNLKIDEGTLLEKNNAYKVIDHNGIFEGITNAYVFIGTGLGGSSFANNRAATNFLQRFFNTTYASIQSLIEVGEFNAANYNNSMNLIVHSWHSAIDDNDFVSRYDNASSYQTFYSNNNYEDLGVEICRYLITGSNNLNDLSDYIPTDDSGDSRSLLDIYMEAAKYFGKPYSEDLNHQGRDLFVERCAQFLGNASINSEDIAEGELSGVIDNVIIPHLLGYDFYVYLSNNQNLSYDKYIAKITQIVNENREIDNSDIVTWFSINYISKSFPYNEKEKEMTDNSLMSNFEPVQAIAFESWGQSDTLDGITVFFEYNNGEEDNWEILQNYVFTLRFSVKNPEISDSVVAKNVIINDYIDERDLKDGVIMLDLAEIFNAEFQSSFNSLSGFFLPITNDDIYPFYTVGTNGDSTGQNGDNISIVNFRSPVMGYGAYYNGRVNNEVRESYLELIFGAPSLSQSLNIKIVDILL